MEENKLQSVIYLEDRVKKQDREILQLKSSLNEASAEIGALNTIIKNQDKQIDRFMKILENNKVHN